MEWQWEPDACTQGLSSASPWTTFSESTARKIESAFSTAAPFERIADPRTSNQEAPELTILFGASDGYQINLRTGTIRAVRRQLQQTIGSSQRAVWACERSINEWVDYPDKISSKLEHGSLRPEIEHVYISLDNLSSQSHRVVFEQFEAMLYDFISNQAYRVRRSFGTQQGSQSLTYPSTASEAFDESINDNLSLSDVAERLSDGSATALDSETQECPICIDNLFPKEVTRSITPTKATSNETGWWPCRLSRCGHVFHAWCITQALRRSVCCPICRQQYGTITGTMPNGDMSVNTLDPGQYPLVGYEQYATIVISYTFPNGVQTLEHPNPGKGYSGTCRTAYLPNTSEGNQVLEFLKIAFDRRLTFAVGTSVTTGEENTVVWNGIHHKTNRSGGPSYFGYPDPEYFSRVKAELAAMGIR